jgi:hypothetical protein
MERFMSFETFDFVRPDQCEIDPTVTYSIENFYNNPGAYFAVLPLNLTKSELQDLQSLQVDNTCPCDPNSPDYGPDVPYLGRCAGAFSPDGYQPKSYYQDPTYRNYVERHFNGYQSLKSEPELMNSLVDLIVKLTNTVADIIPGTLITTGFFTSTADSNVVKDSSFIYPADTWHQDGGRDGRVECHVKRFTFLATLKGDPTLYCTGSYDSDKDQCVPSTSIFSAPLGYGTVHKFGNLYGAFHSGPPMNGQRFVFASSIRYPECYRFYKS